MWNLFSGRKFQNFLSGHQSTKTCNEDLIGSLWRPSHRCRQQQKMVFGRYCPFQWKMHNLEPRLSIGGQFPNRQYCKDSGTAEWKETLEMVPTQCPGQLTIDKINGHWSLLGYSGPSKHYNLAEYITIWREYPPVASTKAVPFQAERTGGKTEGMKERIADLWIWQLHLIRNKHKIKIFIEESWKRTAWEILAWHKVIAPLCKYSVTV